MPGISFTRLDPLAPQFAGALTSLLTLITVGAGDFGAVRVGAFPFLPPVGADGGGARFAAFSPFSVVAMSLYRPPARRAKQPESGVLGLARPLSRRARSVLLLARTKSEPHTPSPTPV